jgi:hypothetical protein
VTVGTNNDKTGYTLVSGPLDAAGVRAAIGLASRTSTRSSPHRGRAQLNSGCGAGQEHRRRIQRGRTIAQALAFLRNKWTLVDTTLTVYDTDDVTVLWTATIARTAGDPVSSSDPA